MNDQTSPALLIKTSGEYVAKILLQHLFASAVLYYSMYFLTIFPNLSQVSDEERFLLYVPSLSLAGSYFLLSIPFILKAYIQSRRQVIEQNNSHLNITTGVFSLSTETIPMQKINHIHAHSSLLDQVFGIASVEITTDSSHTKIDGVDRKEALSLARIVNEKQNTQDV